MWTISTPAVWIDVERGNRWTCHLSYFEFCSLTPNPNIAVISMLGLSQVEKDLEHKVEGWGPSICLRFDDTEDSDTGEVPFTEQMAAEVNDFLESIVRQGIPII